MCTRAPRHGFSLIELLVFIVVVAVALTGVLSVLNIGAKSSADPMVRKQALAAAESLLEEIELQAFTFCDPRDANASTAVNAAGCNTPGYSMDNPGNWGSGKSRHGPEFFNNVADYHNFASTGSVSDILQQASSRLAGYSASVAVTQAGTGFGLPNPDVLRIDVTVAGANESVTLSGFRFRHSPNVGQ